MAIRDARRRGTARGARRVATEWLREIFLEDLGLKLLALLIAAGLWFAVTGLRAPATVRLRGVPLAFTLPEGVEISNEPILEVDVTLEGSQGRLAEVNARNLVARADVTQLKPGERVARLTAQNVTIDLPTGVRVVSIEPRSVALRLEPTIEHEVEVEAKFDGNVPEGYTHGGVQITPPRVRVRGPESHVLAVEKASTEAISLADQRETFLVQTAVDTSDRKVVPLDGVVTVRVEIAEERIERRFGEVAVISTSGGQPQPASAAVTVRGPRSIVTALRPEDLRLALEQAADGALRPRLALPPHLEGRVELVSLTPSEFTINR